MTDMENDIMQALKAEGYEWMDYDRDEVPREVKIFVIMLEAALPHIKMPE